MDANQIPKLKDYVIFIHLEKVTKKMESFHSRKDTDTDTTIKRIIYGFYMFLMDDIRKSYVGLQKSITRLPDEINRLLQVTQLQNTQIPIIKGGYFKKVLVDVYKYMKNTMYSTYINGNISVGSQQVIDTFMILFDIVYPLKSDKSMITSILYRNYPINIVQFVGHYLYNYGGSPEIGYKPDYTCSLETEFNYINHYIDVYIHQHQIPSNPREEHLGIIPREEHLGITFKLTSMFESLKNPLFIYGIIKNPLFIYGIIKNPLSSYSMDANSLIQVALNTNIQSGVIKTSMHGIDSDLIDFLLGNKLSGIIFVFGNLNKYQTDPIINKYGFLSNYYDESLIHSNSIYKTYYDRNEFMTCPNGSFNQFFIPVTFIDTIKKKKINVSFTSLETAFQIIKLFCLTGEYKTTYNPNGKYGDNNYDLSFSTNPDDSKKVNYFIPQYNKNNPRDMYDTYIVDGPECMFLLLILKFLGPSSYRLANELYALRNYLLIEGNSRNDIKKNDYNWGIAPNMDHTNNEWCGRNILGILLTIISSYILPSLFSYTQTPQNPQNPQNHIPFINYRLAVTLYGTTTKNKFTHAFKLVVDNTLTQYMQIPPMTVTDI